MEYKIPHAVKNRPVSIDFDALQDRRSMADKGRRTRVDAVSGDILNPSGDVQPVGGPVMMMQIGYYEGTALGSGCDRVQISGKIRPVDFYASRKVL
ncbi:hypothetical protein O206_22875 [Ochrobactrum sp. EGD-AQ16]|nr:hypothetical protein O206_22875 [Ochrobactrum sp. EGD-AQ16]